MSLEEGDWVKRLIDFDTVELIECCCGKPRLLPMTHPVSLRDLTPSIQYTRFRAHISGSLGTSTFGVAAEIQKTLFLFGVCLFVPSPAVLKIRPPATVEYTTGVRGKLF